jgi:hypothetical protein
MRPLISRLEQAYVALMLAPESEDGSRTVSLARFGEFEVRLVEIHHYTATDVSSLWTELYRHGIQSSLDSYRCEDLEGVEAAADQFTSRARVLHKLTPDTGYRATGCGRLRSGSAAA